MDRLVTIDCWDTVLLNDGDWDPTIESIIRRQFTNAGLNFSEQRWRCVFDEEAAWFTGLLSESLITAPLPTRLSKLGDLLSAGLNPTLLHETKLAVDRAIMSPMPSLMPGVAQFLSWLKSRKVRVCLISNTGWFSSEAITGALAAYDLLQYFDALIFSDRLGAAKPSPRIFEAALTAVSYTGSRSEVVHIGDDLMKDVEGALKSGFGGIHLHPNGSCGPVEHFHCVPDYVGARRVLSNRLGGEPPGLSSDNI